MKITAITSLPHRPEMHRISVDNHPVGYVSSQDVLSLGLSENQELSKDSYSRLLTLIKGTAFYYQALKYADRRLRSKAQVDQYLRLKGCEAEQRQAIIARLEQAGVIDERKFAKAYVHDSLLTTPMSKRKLELKLKRKHLPAAVVAEAVNQAETKDSEALQILIAKKRHLSAYSGNQPKLFRYLLNQGFSFEDIAEQIGRPKRS